MKDKLLNDIAGAVVKLFNFMEIRNYAEMHHFKFPRHPLEKI
jgi:hypothetical protein